MTLQVLQLSSAAEMEPEQQVLVRLACLEGRLLDIRAVVALLLSAHQVSPACAEVPLPAFVRYSPHPRPIPIRALNESSRCTFWL